MGKLTVEESNLSDVADAIRAKAETSGGLVFPDGFISAVEGIQKGIIPTGTKSITTNGPHDVTEFASAWVDVPPTIPDGYVKPIGNLTDALITRTSDTQVHYANIPQGYYVKDGFTITEWKTGQIQGTNTNGNSLTVKYSDIGFIPTTVALIMNTGSPPTNGVLSFFTLVGVGSRCLYRTNSSTITAPSNVHATVNSNGITFPSPNSSVKYTNNNYRWFALR